MWVYKQVTQHRTNGIPTGKTFAALLWDRYNVKMTVSLRNETAVHDLLSTISSTAPWVVVGYDNKLNNAWKRDRSSFISAVDEHRKRPRPQNS